MIYNLVTYLITQFPSINFVTDGWSKASPETAVLISQSGGTEDNYTGRRDYTVQLMSRSKSQSTARTNIEAVADDLKNRFGLVLPAVTIAGKVYPELKTYRIVKIQVPGYIGTTEESYQLYSFNITVTLNYS